MIIVGRDAYLLSRTITNDIEDIKRMTRDEKISAIKRGKQILKMFQTGLD